MGCGSVGFVGFIGFVGFVEFGSLSPTKLHADHPLTRHPISGIESC